VTGSRSAAAVLTFFLLATSCGVVRESAGGTNAASATTVQVGARAPNFSLTSASGEKVSLAAFRGRKPVLLYFSMGPG
jgi:cytochrome oxidase Cu insertion factor (SCO1/SenC/PrrC family)